MMSPSHHRNPLRDRLLWLMHPVRSRRQWQRLSWLEPLEERALLATLDVGGTGEIATPALVTFRGSVTGALTVAITSTSYTITAAEPITITGGIGNAMVWTGSGTNKVTGPNPSVLSITIETSAATNLTVDDSSETAGRNATISATEIRGLGPSNALTGDPMAINFAGANLSSLVVNGGSGGNTYTITQALSSLTSGTLNSGTGADTVNVVSVGGPLAINGQGGTDTVNVGSNGSLQGVSGPVRVTNAAGKTALTLDDSLNNVAKNVTISTSAITGLTPSGIDFEPANLSSLVVSGGTGNNNTFTISDTSAPTTLNTGTGYNADTYKVNVQGTRQPLTINDQTTTGPSPAIPTINLGNVDVLGVQGIHGMVTVSGSQTLTDLSVNDSGDLTGRSATLATVDGFSVLSGLAPQPIRFSRTGLHRLFVTTGSGTNAMTVDFLGTNPLPLPPPSEPGLNTLNFEGGGPNSTNTLNLQGGSFTQEVYSASTPGVGSISFDSTSMAFSRLMPINDTINDTAPAARYFFDYLAPSTTNTINIIDGPVNGGVRMTQINGGASPNFEPVNFANKTQVTVRAVGSSAVPPSPQIVTVNNPTQAAGLTNLAISTGALNDTITLTATPAGVATSVNTSLGNDVVNVSAAGLGAGGTDSVDGGGGTDTLNVDAARGAVTISPTTVSVAGHPTLNLANFTQVNITNAADRPLSPAFPQYIATNSGILTNAVVGSFTDADPTSQASQFTATINWGDGFPVEPGTVTQPGGPGTPFNVVGSHTYVGGGLFPIIVSVLDTGNTGTQVLRGVPFTISDSGGSSTTVGSITASPIIVSEGESFTRVVSTIPAPNPFVQPSDISALINWGDGTPSTPARIQVGSLPGGFNSFVAIATHTYANAGFYPITVTASYMGSPIPVPFQLPGAIVTPADLTVTNNNDDDVPHSLRHVIKVVNTRPAGGTIKFNIPGPGPHTVDVGATTHQPLPAVTVPNVTIDGSSQPGFDPENPHPVIVLNGTDAGPDVNGQPANGLRIAGGNTTVKGLVIQGFRDNAGILLEGQGGDVVEGNYIGTDVTGTSAVPNDQGVAILGTSDNMIGRAGGVGERNVISGNTSAGIFTAATNNVVQNNFIGTNAAGTATLGNSLHGIFLGNGSSNNTIGGNVISGNGQFPVANLPTQGGVGIYIFGTNTSGNVVQGNKIGTNAAGTALDNRSVIGVLINQSPGNTVQGNVISGNRFIGLEIAGGTAADNQVQGNKIGTNSSGTAPIANEFDGVFINDAPNNSIGGNTISGNGSVGIQLFGPLTSGNVIRGNALGLDATGRPTLPNRAGGIFVNTNPLANQLGGTGPDQANQGQVRPIFGLAGLANPESTSSVAARRRSRQGKSTPVRTRAVTPSHPSDPSAHIPRHLGSLLHWSKIAR